jgi:hypothetical protein
MDHPIPSLRELDIRALREGNGEGVIFLRATR